MIALYLFAALAAVIAYLLAAPLRRKTRITVALLVLVVPSAALTAWVFAVGDKASSEDVTVRFQ